MSARSEITNLRAAAIPRRIIEFIIILLWGCFVEASPAVAGDDPSAYISGTVKDAQTGEPIPDVHVLIVGTHLGRATDTHGWYFIGPFEHGSVIVEFSHVSYGQIQDTLHLQPRDTLIHDVRLVKRSIELDEVEITAKHPRASHLWKGTSGRILKREDIEGTGMRGLGDIIRLMSPGSSVVEVGEDVYIDLNKSSRRTTRPRTAFFRDLQQTNPLIILNGMRIGKSPLALNSLIKTEEIDEIVVLKGLEADMYGYEGRDGIIFIESTPQPDTSGLSIFEKILYATGVIGAVLLVSLLLF
ncbi:MAG: carboxypeptidase-like regulatory domain-containing protein [Bacteroidota bacterium]